jgi:drug/metabolite transporter (DMT)-like permease
VHATWNVLAARAADSVAGTAVALATGALVLAPIAAAAGHVGTAALPYAAASMVLELAYFALLATAYDRAPLSVVYPLARGAAPVLVLLAGVLALGIGASAAQAAGVALVAVGILLVRGVRDRPRPGDLALALGVAACLAGYTLVDKEALHHASPLPYLELVLAPTALVYLATVLWRRGAAEVRAAVSPGVLVAGVGMFAAYGLTLAALRLAPAAAVAAVRECSVVIATGMAALFLGERIGPVRALGAVLVTAGIVAISLGS